MRVNLVADNQQIVGRRPVMLTSLLLMAVGCALCGAAHSMPMMIAGRGELRGPHIVPLTESYLVVQGLGAGGISSSNAIIISDLVPLRERGQFNALVGMSAPPIVIQYMRVLTLPHSSWSVFNGLGPVIAGALTQHGQWRWLFCTCNLQRRVSLGLIPSRHELPGSRSRRAPLHHVPPRPYTAGNSPRKAEAGRLDVRCRATSLIGHWSDATQWHSLSYRELDVDNPRANMGRRDIPVVILPGLDTADPRARGLVRLLAV
jgi:MFS family permease